MNPALESKLEDLMQVQAHDDGGAVLGMLLQPEKASERVKDRVLKAITPRATTGADAKRSRSLQRQVRGSRDEGQGQSWHDKTQDRDGSTDRDSDRDTGRSRHDTTQQVLRYLTLQGSCGLGDLHSPRPATFTGLTLEAEPQINNSSHPSPLPLGNIHGTDVRSGT